MIGEILVTLIMMDDGSRTSGMCMMQQQNAQNNGFGMAIWPIHALSNSHHQYSCARGIAT